MFEITVNTRRALVGTKELITTNSAGIQVQFTFSEDWDGLSKFAIFRNAEIEESKVTVALTSSGLCTLPSENCAEEYVDEPVFVGVYGTDGLGTVIIPTVWASLGGLREGAVYEGVEPAEPTPDMWAQILAIANEALDIAEACETQEEARQAAEALRVEAENLRAQAEQGRVGAETARVQAENLRVQAENLRAGAESSRASAEALRASAETGRANAESTRQTNESTRQSNEQSRAAAESTRAQNESDRQSAESGRAQAEQIRVNAENIRADAETARASAESTRATAESGRATAESNRATAEGQRVSAETARAQAENSRVQAESARAQAESLRVQAEADRAEEFATFEGTISDLNRQISDIEEVTRNLCDINVLNKGGVVVEDGVATGTTSAFNAAFSLNAGGIPFGVTFKELTQYTLSFLARNNSGSTSGVNGQTLDVIYTDGTSKTIGIRRNQSEYTRIVLTSDAGKTVEKFCFGYANGGTDVNNIKEMQLEEGAAASVYIPHISAVDDIAREQLNVDLPEKAALIEANTDQLKLMNSWNDFSINYPATTKNGVTVSVTDGTLTATGTLTGSTYWDVYAGTLAGAGLVAGKTYYADFGLHGKHVDGYITMYTNSGSGYNLLLDVPVGIVKTTIPANTQSILLRYFAPDSVPVNFSHKIIFSEALSNSVLTNSAEMRFLRAWGTGDCTIIKFANGETLVIDFGLNEQQGTLQASWQSAISEMKITHIDYAIISHYHGDHIGMLLAGVGDLIDSNTVFFTAPLYTTEQLEGLAWMDSMSGDTVVQNYTDVQTVLNNAGVKRVYPTEGETVCIGNALVQFWNCNHTEYLNQYIAHTMYDYNPCSLCNYITIGTQRVCFSGDISEAVMTKYQTSVLPSQIFKVNHHSVGYAVVPLFLNSLMPDLDVTMLGHSFNALNVSQNQIWCEENCVPTVITGVNEKTLILKVTDNGYSWQNSVRKLVRADEGWTTQGT